MNVSLLHVEKLIFLKERKRGMILVFFEKRVVLKGSSAENRRISHRKSRSSFPGLSRLCRFFLLYFSKEM